MVYCNYIDGDFVGSEEVFVNSSPSNTMDVVGEYAFADRGLTLKAIDAASGARDVWAATPIGERARILDQAGSEILVRSSELSVVLAREQGKTLREAEAEVVRAGHIFKYYAGEAVRNSGDHLQALRPDVEILIAREPVGVIGVITPWNFPIAIPAWKIAPALAYGNSVVFKPAELTPASAWYLVDILSRAGLPPGVLNLVMGRGDEVGDQIAKDPRVHGVSFTGSRSVGARVLANTQSSQSKVQLEMGGKNPLVICDDADIDLAVEGALDGAFGSAGQRCTASSRLIVLDGVHDAFVERLLDSMANIRVGDACDPQTRMGPVVDETHLDRNLKYLDTAVKEGAGLHGGEVLERSTPGYFLSPALLTDTSNHDTINREEVFGPVASIIRVVDIDEAIYVANDSEFGLSAGIYTSSLSVARRFRRDVRVGMVMVNLPTAGVDYHVPFGGVAGSSYGAREQGSYARDFYTETKTCYVSE